MMNKGTSGVPTKSSGSTPQHSKGIAAEPPVLPVYQLLAEGDLVSKNIVANSCQFIAKRFCRHTGIGLGCFPVIIASKPFTE